MCCAILVSTRIEVVKHKMADIFSLKRYHQNSLACFDFFSLDLVLALVSVCSTLVSIPSGAVVNLHCFRNSLEET